MEETLAFAAEAPAATLLLATIVVASLVGLFVAPALLERNLFRPHWLLPRDRKSVV